MKLAVRLTALCLCLLPAAARAGDFDKERLDNWHQWRGPLANGTAPKGDPPIKWDEKTNIKWKADLPGRGSATPAVWKDRVFVLTAIDTRRVADPKDLPNVPRGDAKTTPPKTYHQFVVLCFDRKTGKELWRRMATEQVPHEGHHPTHSYAAASPTTDGERLYASFGSRGVYCYDPEGKLLWKRDFGRMRTRLGWGEAVTPVVHGNSLVIAWDQEKDSSLICLNAKTGETRWKVPRDEPTGWETPLVVEHDGTTQVVVNGTRRARGYDLATGKELWQCGGQTVNAIPSPVRYGDHVICMSGYRGAFACSIPLSARGDVTNSDKLAWRLKKGTPYVPSPLLAGDRLYFTEERQAKLTCVDAKTGKVLMDRERLPGLETLYASPVCAAGRIYLVDRSGTALVLKQGDKLEVLATNQLDDGFDASPVVVGKQLFLRAEKHLYCIEEK